MPDTSHPSSRPTPAHAFYGQTPGDLSVDRNVGLLIRHLHGLIHKVIDLDTLPLGLTANQWRMAPAAAHQTQGGGYAG